MAVEAQDEMKNIITKFVDLLKEEEQQLEVQAGERNTYMCILDTACYVSCHLYFLLDFSSTLNDLYQFFPMQTPGESYLTRFVCTE